MSVKVGQTFRRKEPRGDKWDDIVIKAASPLSEGELVCAPVNPFQDDDGPAIVSTSATPDSILAAYELVGDEPTAPDVELGRNAIGAWF